MKDTDYPLIIAHRGASHDFYENSFQAFSKAIEYNADMIELDVHLTKDGYFVVHHDPTIKIDKDSYNISDTPLSVIEKLELPNGEPIPLLETVLERYLKDIMFNIEIKCPSTHNKFDELLSGLNIDTSRIIVSSFHRTIIHELRETKHNYKLAFLYLFFGFGVHKMLKYDYIKAFNPYFKVLTKRTVNNLHEKKKEVYTWVVNRPKEVKRALKLQVEGIITDRPKEVREMVENYLKLYSQL